MPNIIEKVISIAPSFDLEAAMQEANAADEAADGNDEANIPLNLGKPNRTFSMHPSSESTVLSSSRPRSSSEPSSFFSSLPGLGTVISMCSTMSPSAAPSDKPLLTDISYTANIHPPSAPSANSVRRPHHPRMPTSNNRRTNKKRSQKRAKKNAAVERD